MSVFDTPSVHYHLDAELGYTYIPASLVLFDRVSREVQHIGGEIANALSKLGTDNKPLLSRFDSSASVYPLLNPSARPQTCLSCSNVQPYPITQWTGRRN